MTGRKMELRKEEVKEQVEALWRQCFDDGDSFVRLYFLLRYEDGINRFLTAEGGKRVVSALQLVPYPMTWEGTILSVGYVSGACTHPDYRSQGLMRRLLRETHRRMFREGSSLAALIPASEGLRGYYAKAGYASCFPRKVVTFCDRELTQRDRRCRTGRAVGIEPPVWEYVSRRQAVRPNCLQHTLKDWRFIVAEHCLSGGWVWTAQRENRLVGVALCSRTEQGKAPYVKEIFCDDREAHDSLLHGILEYSRADRLTTVRRADNFLSMPYGMGRIIDAGRLLSLYAEAHPDERFCCRMDGDEDIPENNGIYRVGEGRCTKGEISDGAATVFHTPESLAQTLFASRIPYSYMGLMVDE